MDKVIDELAGICELVRYETLPAPVVGAAVQRLVDSLGCAVGAVDCDAAVVGRAAAPRIEPRGSVPVARSIGDEERQTTLEAAGFVNSTMIRYLDFNDSFPGAAHPSDALGPILALADALSVSGEELVTAVVAGYEVLLRCTAATKLRRRGWDQGWVIGLGVAAGASVLLGLDRERTRHALSITAVSNVPLRVTRAGQLSMWKGAATAYAARNALFGTLLAAEGMSAPDAAIEGRHGLQDLVTGPFDLQPFAGDVDDYMIAQVRTKCWPACSDLQAVVWAAIDLRQRVDLDEIAHVDLATCHSGWQGTGSEPGKWDPQSRETADHSMPYVFVRVMQAGELNLSAFEPEAYLDHAARPLMSKIAVHLDDEIEARYPTDVIVRATATTLGGNTVEVEIVNPRGHEKNPVTDAEVSAKFLRLAAPALGAVRADEALSFWTTAHRQSDVSAGLDLLAMPGRNSPTGEARGPSS